MGLFDSLKNEVAGAVGGGAAHAGMVEAVLGMLNHPGAGGTGGAGGGGGIGGLIQAFEQQGLGHLVQGWIGNGPNPGISAAQVEQVLGTGKIAELAQQAGIPPQVASSVLASVLPALIDRLTPNGTVPQGPVGAPAQPTPGNTGGGGAGELLEEGLGFLRKSGL